MATAEKPESAKLASENYLVEIMGDHKPWQLIIVALCFYTKLASGGFCLATVFLTPGQSYKCSDPVGVAACSADCKAREFDRSVFEETIISQWDLVCGNSYLASLSQALFMFGIMVGSMIIGSISDKYGRRPAFLLCHFMEMIVSPLITWSTWFWLFCVLRFLTAVAAGGSMIISFIITVEIIGAAKRELITVAYHVPLVAAHMSLALFSYFLRHWKWYHLCITVSTFAYIFFYWLIPETPRYLISTGRLDEAVEVLTRAAKFNKMPTENIRAKVEAAYAIVRSEAVEQKHGTLLDLFRNPKLCVRTIAMAFNWFVMCLTYYGVAQYMGGMLGNVFINVLFGAFLSLIGVLICYPFTKYLGRKITLIFSQLVCGISLLIIAVMGDTGAIWPAILASFGIFGSLMSFTNAYLYSGEIFPTVVRSSGFGFSSLVGRFGSIAAPFVVYTSEIGKWIPPFIFGIAAILAAASAVFLPETKGSTLPDTIAEGEAFKSKGK